MADIAVVQFEGVDGEEARWRGVVYGVNYMTTDAAQEDCKFIGFRCSEGLFVYEKQQNNNTKNYYGFI